MSAWNRVRAGAAVARVDTERFDPLRAGDPRGGLSGFGTRIRYDVRRMEVEAGRWVTEYTVRFALTGKPADVAAVQSTLRHALAEHVNVGRRLPNGDQFHVRLEFDDADPHARIAVRPGSGRTNQEVWHAEDSIGVVLHETLHYLGLPDEYVDSDTVFRAPSQRTRSGLDGEMDPARRGVMGRDARSESFALPQRYLDRIAEVTAASAVVHDTPLPVSGQSPQLTVSDSRSEGSGSAPEPTGSRPPSAMPRRTGRSAPAEPPVTTTAVETAGGSRSFEQQLARRLTPVGSVVTVGPSLRAELTRDEAGTVGFVATAPAVVGDRPGVVWELANRYAQVERPANGFALVVGLNRAEGRVNQADLNAELADFKARWRGDFPVSVVPFTWKAPAGRDVSDQKVIPYGLIREFVARQQVTLDAIKAIRGTDQHQRELVYLHTGDGDVSSLATPDNKSLFAEAARRLSARADVGMPPEVVSGGYLTPADAGQNAPLVRQAAGLDLAVRQAMALVDGRSVYYPEPNTFVRIGESERLENDVTFGEGDKEGRALVDSVLKQRYAHDNAAIFDRTLAITTDGSRIGARVTAERPAGLFQLSQSHADPDTWAKQIQAYAQTHHDFVLTGAQRDALRDTVFYGISSDTTWQQVQHEIPIPVKQAKSYAPATWSRWQEIRGALPDALRRIVIQSRLALMTELRRIASEEIPASQGVSGAPRSVGRNDDSGPGGSGLHLSSSAPQVPLMVNSGSDAFKGVQRRYRFSSVNSVMRGDQAPRHPDAGHLPGFVATVPATADVDLASLVARYAAGFGDATSLHGRFALVVGVNGWVGSDARSDRQARNIAQTVDSLARLNPPFPVVAIGFTWSNNDIRAGGRPDQRTIPYGAIRELLARHPDAERLLAWVGSDGAPTYLHTGDADVHDLSSLFDRATEAIDRYTVNDFPPELISGGYRVESDRPPEVRAAGELDLRVRDAMAKIDPRSVYFPEPNTFIRVDGRLERDATFGHDSSFTSQEGRGIVTSVLRQRAAARTGNEQHMAVFDSRLAVTTNGERIAQNFQSRGIAQSHSRKDVWRDLIKDYIETYQQEVRGFDERLADFAFLPLEELTPGERRARRQQLIKELEPIKHSSALGIAINTQAVLRRRNHDQDAQRLAPANAPADDGLSVGSRPDGSGSVGRVPPPVSGVVGATLQPSPAPPPSPPATHAASTERHLPAENPTTADGQTVPTTAALRTASPATTEQVTQIGTADRRIAGTPPAYLLDDGVLGSARIGAVAGRSLTDSDIGTHLAATLANALPDDLRPGASRQIAELVRRLGADRAVRRLAVGETMEVTIGAEPATLRLVLQPTGARPVSADEGGAIVSGAPEAPTAASDTTTTEITQSNVSPAVPFGMIVTSLTTPLHAEAIVRAGEERILHHSVDTSAKGTRSVTVADGALFDVTAELSAHVFLAGTDPGGAPDRRHSAPVTDVLRLAFPEFAPVEAERVRMREPRVDATTFVVAEAITGLATLRADAQAWAAANTVGPALVDALDALVSKMVTNDNGRQLLTGAVVGDPVTVLTGGRPQHIALTLTARFDQAQRLGTGEASIVQESETTDKRTDGQVSTSSMGVGLAVTPLPAVTEIATGDVVALPRLAVTAGASRGQTAATTIEGTHRSKLTYDGDTVLYRLSGRYEVTVDTTLADRQHSFVSDDAAVYVRVPNHEASRFEEGLTAERDLSPAARQREQPPPTTMSSVNDHPDDIPTGLLAVEQASPTGTTVADLATELLGDAIRHSAVLPAEVAAARAQLGDRLATTRLVGDFDALRGAGVTTSVTLGGRRYDVTATARLGHRLSQTELPAVTLETTTETADTIEAKDKQGRNIAGEFNPYIRFPLLNKVTGANIGIGLGATGVWNRAHASTAASGGVSKHTIKHSGAALVREYAATFHVSLTEHRDPRPRVLVALGLARHAAPTTHQSATPGIVRLVLPASVADRETGAAAPTLNPTEADLAAQLGNAERVLPNPGTVGVIRLRGVDDINRAVARALTDIGITDAPRLTPVTLAAQFDRLVNGGLVLPGPPTAHSFSHQHSTVTVTARVYQPRLLGTEEAVTSEQQNSGKVSVASSTGSGFGWGVRGTVGIPLASSQASYTSGQDILGTATLAAKRTTGVTDTSAHHHYRGDMVYEVTARSWTSRLGRPAEPVTATVRLLVPDGTEFLAAHRKAIANGFPVGDGQSPLQPAAEERRLPPYLADHASLGPAVVDGVSGLDQLASRLGRVLNEVAPHTLRHAAAPTVPGAAPSVRALVTPATAAAVLPDVLSGGVSTMVTRPIWKGQETVLIRVSGRLHTADAQHVGTEQEVALRHVAQGDDKGAEATTTGRGWSTSIALAYNLREGGHDLTAARTNTTGGRPGIAATQGGQRRTGATDTHSSKIKDTAKLDSGIERFTVPVQYTIEVFRHRQYANLFDKAGLRTSTDRHPERRRVHVDEEVTGTVDLLIPTVSTEGSTDPPPSRTATTVGPISDTPPHPRVDRIELSRSDVVVEAMPRGPLTDHLRDLLERTTNPLGAASRSTAARVAGEATPGGAKLDQFLSEAMRVGHLQRLLDATYDTTVVHDGPLTTKVFRLRLGLQVVNPAYLGSHTVSREQETAVNAEHGRTVQPSRTVGATLGLGGQGPTGEDARLLGGPTVSGNLTTGSGLGHTRGTEQATTTKHDGIYYRYRADAVYHAQARLERSNVFIERAGLPIHREISVDRGLYFSISVADAERLGLPLPSASPNAEPEPLPRSEPLPRAEPPPRSEDPTVGASSSEAASGDPSGQVLTLTNLARYVRLIGLPLIVCLLLVRYQPPVLTPPDRSPTPPDPSEPEPALWSAGAIPGIDPPHAGHEGQVPILAGLPALPTAPPRPPARGESR